MGYGPDYDRYLEAERERRDAEGDAFEAFCEANGLDPDEQDSDEAWEQFQAAAEAELENAQEAMAEERAERMRLGDDW